jgi:hypothetical protein
MGAVKRKINNPLDAVAFLFKNNIPVTKENLSEIAKKSGYSRLKWFFRALDAELTKHNIKDLSQITKEQALGWGNPDRANDSYTKTGTTETKSGQSAYVPEDPVQRKILENLKAIGGNAQKLAGEIEDLYREKAADRRFMETLLKRTEQEKSGLEMAVESVADAKKEAEEAEASLTKTCVEFSRDKKEAAAVFALRDVRTNSPWATYRVLAVFVQKNEKGQADVYFEDIKKMSRISTNATRRVLEQLANDGIVAPNLKGGRNVYFLNFGIYSEEFLNYVNAVSVEQKLERTILPDRGLYKELSKDENLILDYMHVLNNRNKLTLVNLYDLCYSKHNMSPDKVDDIAKALLSKVSVRGCPLIVPLDYNGRLKPCSKKH